MHAAAGTTSRDASPAPATRDAPGKAGRPRTRSVGDFQREMARAFSHPDLQKAKERGPSESRVRQNLERLACRWKAFFSRFDGRRKTWGWLLLWALIIMAAILGLSYANLDRSHLLHRDASRPTETLVLYGYSNSDPEYRANLAFFVRHGMWEGDGCNYIIVVPKGQSLLDAEEKALSKLPANARVLHSNESCSGWGLFAAILNSSIVDDASYKHIVMLDSSVRGPFLSPYWPAKIHWSRIFTSRLSGRVKLVGSTISCQPAFRNGDSWQPKRSVPHVQTSVVATDPAGLDVLKKDNRIFDCYDSRHDRIWFSELSASEAILEANYTIDSLMLRYQNVDWQDHKNQDCNAMQDPDNEFANDGVSLNPMEVLFVKVDSFSIQKHWLSQHEALTATSWLRRQGASGTVSANHAAQFLHYYRLGRIFTMQLRGRECFDVEYYRKGATDVRIKREADLWDHFLQIGQFEARPFRFTCPDRLKAIGVAATAVKQLLAEPFKLKALPPADTAELDFDLGEITQLQEDEVKELHRHIMKKIDNQRKRRGGGGRRLAARRAS